MKGIVSGLVSLVAVGAMTVPAAATVLGNVGLDFKTHQGIDVSVHYTANGFGQDKNMNTAAGRFKFLVTSINSGNAPPGVGVGDTIYTFCIELAEFSNDGNFDVHDDLSDLPIDDTGGLNGITMTSASSALLAELFTWKFWDVSKQNKAALTTAELIDVAAFQLATWEIIYELVDGDAATDANLDLTSGEFTADNIGSNSAAVLAQAEAYLDYIIDNVIAVETMYGFSDLTKQDQGYGPSPIPLPAPLALAGVGVLGVFAGRRRLSRLLT